MLRLGCWVKTICPRTPPLVRMYLRLLNVTADRRTGYRVLYFEELQLAMFRSKGVRISSYFLDNAITGPRHRRPYSKVL